MENKNLNRLQYITDSPAQAEHACKAGIRWVQARVKNKTGDDLKKIISEIVAVCRKYQSMVIVNDHLHLALECKADGVHLGKEDMPLAEARNIIGNREFIVGGTANTLEDVVSLSIAKADYIGLGPFRFTTTKEKLSPVLGEEGYRRIVTELKNLKIDAPPVYAIGGILPGDAETIRKTGIYGVAVSGAVTNAEDKQKVIADLYNGLNMKTHAEQH